MAKGKSGKRNKGKRGSRTPSGSAPPPAAPPDEAPAPSAEVAAAVAPERPADPAPVVWLRRIDAAIGTAEHVALAGLLIALISTALIQTVYGNLLNRELTWSSEVIRYGVFLIAIIGAALAAQKQRMISMDVLTRLLGPSKKAIARIIGSLLVIFLCALLIKGGLIVHDKASTFKEDFVFVDPAMAVLALPLGGALIALHYLFHLSIDIVYLATGRVAPETDGMQVH